MRLWVQLEMPGSIFLTLYIFWSEMLNTSLNVTGLCCSHMCLVACLILYTLFVQKRSYNELSHVKHHSHDVFLQDENVNYFYTFQI